MIFRKIMAGMWLIAFIISSYFTYYIIKIDGIKSPWWFEFILALLCVTKFIENIKYEQKR